MLNLLHVLAYLINNIYKHYTFSYKDSKLDYSLTWYFSFGDFFF